MSTKYVYAPGQEALSISYDNTVSGLTAENVQAAIDELVSGGGSGANTALSNLASTAINTDLIPDGGGKELGQAGTNFWLGLYVQNIYDVDGTLAFEPGSRQIWNSGIAIFDAASNATIKVLGDNTASGALQLNRFANDFSVTLKAPDSLAADLVLNMPLADGTNLQVIATDGSGNLSFVSAASIPVDSDIIPDGDNTRDLGASGLGFAELYVNKVFSNDGTELMDFSSGNLIFNSDGDVNFNCNAAPYRMNFGSDNIRLFGMSGTTSPVVEWREIGGGNFVALKGPDSLGADLTFTLPSADANGPMVSDGSGALSLVAGATGTFTTVDGKTVTVTDGVITSIV